MFGRGAVRDFLRENDLAGIVRAHEVQEHGFQADFATSTHKATVVALKSSSQGCPLFDPKQKNKGCAQDQLSKRKSTEMRPGKRANRK